jgi:lipoprotein-releasing system ATP-binding protein
MMATPVLELKGVTRRYVTAAGALDVLTGVDLTLARGEMIGLVGPSGSGKSTLLHTAGLLEHPDSGEVILEGIPCHNLGEGDRTRLRRTRLGFVYQFHHLLPEFSARDNVAAPMMIDGVKRSLARERAGELLATMGLADRLDHQPGQLSGGEQQRVAIARALANRPGLLIADEPTGNLDAATTMRVFEALLRQCRENGVGALIATHNVALTHHMDRVMTLREGRLVEFTGPAT